MSYSGKEMNQTPESEGRKENPHRQFLRRRNLDNIGKVLSGELTAEQLAEQLADREIELEDRADHDGLTGILNYQGFVDAVTQNLAIIHRSDMPAYMVLLDGDRLKEINDTKGKLMGNKLIQTYAQVLSQVAKQHSNHSIIIGRFGGDEFSMLIVGSDRKETQQVLEEVQSLIPLAAKDSLEDPKLENTVSIGAITLLPNDDVLTGLNKADQNLREAKKTRNTIFFDSQVTSTHK